MSYNPAFGRSNVTSHGDVSCGKGQLGMTTATIDTSVGSINHLPGAQYSDYYSHYIVNISAGNSANFILAPIDTFTGVAIGYTMCIDCLTTGSQSPADSLIIENSAATMIGQLWSGGKIFLIAVAPPNTWKTAYSVPEGNDNRLIVYPALSPNIGGPRVQLLPIVKEFYVNNTDPLDPNRYGIKSIESFDNTEPTNLPAGAVSYTQLNRIVIEGSTNFQTTNMNSLVNPVNNFFAACENVNVRYQPADNSVASMIACYGSQALEQLGSSKGIFVAGCGTCLVDNSLGNQQILSSGILHSTLSQINGNNNGLEFINSSILSSNNSTIETVAAPNDVNRQTTIHSCNKCIVSACIDSSVASSVASGLSYTNQSTIMGSDTGTCSHSTLTNMMGTYTCNITNEVLGTMISCDSCSGTIDGDGVTTRGATGFNNNRAGVTLLSSFNAPPLVSGRGSDLRYIVTGGYNGASTWSIDSKTGNYYGLGTFTGGQALPGFAEMFENLTTGVIPNGRLLRLEGGKVRLAKNGESGFMISRPFESAAFVGGHPQYDWPKKYLVDEFGIVQTETISTADFKARLLSEGKPQSEIDAMVLGETITVKKLNPEYKKDTVYVPRSNRLDQWTTCEKSGIVVVEQGLGSATVGDYLISGPDGIAKPTTRVTNIKVLEVINDKYVKVDLSNQHVNDYFDTTAAITDGILSQLPTDISIRNIQIAANSFIVSKKSRCKIVVNLIGDVLLSTDISIMLICNNSQYDLLVSYTKMKNGSYSITGLYKGDIAPDTYQLVFMTTKTLPAECKVCIKV